MTLNKLYSTEKDFPVISYEVFPPKEDIDGQKTENLFNELWVLNAYKPSLISVTYGAGGSNRYQSLEIIKRIKNDLNVTPMPHFTCVSTDKENIKNYLNEIESLGIQNILALRGDIPSQGQAFDDFKYASELVEYIKEETSLSVAVAGYPEGHIEADSMDDDIKYLKNKLLKGADVVYTQLFFNNECYFNYVEKCQSQGINTPIIPGVMPIISYNSIQKMLSLCNIDVPKELFNVIEKHKNDGHYIKAFGVEYATKQCEELLGFGVKGLHFYTLNKSASVSKILENLGVG